MGKKARGNQEPRGRAQNPETLPLGITMGDPAGIGPEVILKALNRRESISDITCGPAGCRVIGSRRVFELEQKRLGTHVDLALVDDSIPMDGAWRMGRVQEKCGRSALAALDTGIDLLKRGEIRALVTAPVSKEALRLAGFSCPGQTEFLARRLGAKRYAMLAWTPRFKVVFVTIHLPLSRAARYVTARAVAEKIGLLHQFLEREAYGVPRETTRSFRICVMAFNPHGSEFSLGEEERIAEGIRLARRAGIDAYGPVPADAAVPGALRRESLQESEIRTGDSGVAPDSGRPTPGTAPGGFVAMYHDQAMIPAKLLGRDSGVNVTLGLPYVRTSPLHGTAFDIAGKGIASCGSLLAALRLASLLSAGKGERARSGPARL